MRRNRDRRRPEVEEPRRLAEKPPLEAAGLAAAESGQAVLGEAGPARRQHGCGWFEQPLDPAPATAAPAVGGEPQPGTLVLGPAPRRRWAWLLSALAAMLAVGMVLGFAVGSIRWDGQPTSAPATGAPATQPARPTPAGVVVRPVASSACVETARRGDQLIELFTSNQRIRAGDLLVAYTVASRQCRRDASP
jgi:hypothetical protein